MLKSKEQCNNFDLSNNPILKYIDVLDGEKEEYVNLSAFRATNCSKLFKRYIWVLAPNIERAKEILQKYKDIYFENIEYAPTQGLANKDQKIMEIDEAVEKYNIKGGGIWCDEKRIWGKTVFNYYYCSDVAQERLVEKS